MSEVVVGEVRSRQPRIAGRYRSPTHLTARSKVEKKTALLLSVQVLTVDRYVGLCCGIKILALSLFLVDWWLIRRRRHLEDLPAVLTVNDLVVSGSMISLNNVQVLTVDRYVGLCCGIKILALSLFLVDWWLIRRRRHLEDLPAVLTVNDLVVSGSMISLN
ncbi:Solute carrier organic anion transporter member 5A1, partial [Homalodisca vitripennis]